MTDFIIKILILAFSIYLVGKITKLFYVEDFYVALITAFVLAIVNAIIRPILHIFFFPIHLLTLGLFIFFVNGLCLIIVSKIVPKFKIKGCFTAAIAAILISLVNMFLESIIP